MGPCIRQLWRWPAILFDLTPNAGFVTKATLPRPASHSGFLHKTLYNGLACDGQQWLAVVCVWSHALAMPAMGTTIFIPTVLAQRVPVCRSRPFLVQWREGQHFPRMRSEVATTNYASVRHR
jgi:hypothetical protein